MTSRIFWRILGICSISLFVTILLAYAFQSRNPLTARLHFAIFFSIAPAAVTLVLFWMFRISVSWFTVTAVYLICASILLGIQMFVR